MYHDLLYNKNKTTELFQKREREILHQITIQERGRSYNRLRYKREREILQQTMIREGDPTTDYDTRGRSYNRLRYKREREILQQTTIQERKGDSTTDYDTRERERDSTTEYVQVREGDPTTY
jgi:hypothetical protein